MSKAGSPPIDDGDDRDREKVDDERERKKPKTSPPSPSGINNDNGSSSALHEPRHRPLLMELIVPFLELQTAALGLGRTCRWMHRWILGGEGARQLWIFKEGAVLRALGIDRGLLRRLRDEIVLAATHAANVDGDAADRPRRGRGRRGRYLLDSEDGGVGYCGSLWEAFCGEGSSLSLYGVDEFGGSDREGDDDNEPPGSRFGCVFEGVCDECGENCATHRVVVAGGDCESAEGEIGYRCEDCIEDGDCTTGDDGPGSTAARQQRVVELLRCEECDSTGSDNSAAVPCFVVGENQRYCGRCMDGWPLKKICWGQDHDIGYENCSDWGPFDLVTPDNDEDDVLEDIWDNFFDGGDHDGRDDDNSDDVNADALVPHGVLPLWEHNGMGSGYIRLLMDFRERKEPPATS